MYKIGVMGGRETVMGFKALGLEVYPVDNAEEARRTFRDVTGGDNGGEEYDPPEDFDAT